MKLEPGKSKVFIVLHNIRSVYNVGSIFRTADCLGITDILLVGVTPTPVDRFWRARKDFAKVSLGAERTICWKYFRQWCQALKFLKSQGAQLIAIEQAPLALDYRKVKPRYPTAFIFGNEVRGIPARILKQCDIVAEIPMRGCKESLNVSVAAGIALARMLNC